MPHPATTPLRITAVRVSYLAERRFLAEYKRRDLATIAMAREIALWGLLHDASEAYLKDMPKPVKHAPGMGEMYRAIERMVMAEVIVRFDLMPHEPSVVKEADVILCSTEKRDLMTNSSNRPGSITLPETILPTDPATADLLFLRRYEALTMERKAERLAVNQ